MTVHCVKRRVIAVLALLAAALVTGCAGVLPQVERAPSKALVAAVDAPLPAAVSAAQLPEGASGVWPLLQATYALDARLALRSEEL